MNVYSLALFLHVVAALALFIGLGVEWLSVQRLRRVESVEHAIEWTRGFVPLRRLRTGSMLIILVSGLYMTAAVWGHVWWAAVALLAIVLMGVVEGTLVGGRARAIERAVRGESGALSAGLRNQLRSERLRVSVHLRAAIALGIVFLMTAKPGFTGSLLTVAASVIVGLAVSAPALRRNVVRESMA